jgi:hypothetical protein
VKAGHPEPEFGEQAGSVWVRFLPSAYIAPHRVAHDLTQRQRELLQILANHGDLPHYCTIGQAAGISRKIGWNSQLISSLLVCATLAPFFTGISLANKIRWPHSALFHNGETNG